MMRHVGSARSSRGLGPQARLVVDLSGVTFVTAVGIVALLH
jgi:hypothetical protein